jgi:hypothetical protein
LARVSYLGLDLAYVGLERNICVNNIYLKKSVNRVLQLFGAVNRVQTKKITCEFKTSQKVFNISKVPILIRDILRLK